MPALAAKLVVDRRNREIARRDRRAEQRLRTVFWIGKVTSDHDVGLWRIHNFSDSGMMLETHVEVIPGERLEISLSDRVTVAGTVAWADGGRCGIRFSEPIACDAVLGELAAERRALKYRPPRLPVSRSAIAYCEHGLQAVRVVNISQHGIGLAQDGRLRIGTRLKLVLENGMERRGVVRWSSDNSAGLLLIDPFCSTQLESSNLF